MNKFFITALLVYACYLTTQAKIYDIINFGALPDNKTVNTVYIQNAIDSCSADGGGTVYIPAGIFITGTLELKSNVNLFLESGAELKGSPDIGDYRDYKAVEYDSVHYGIIYAHKATNVSITGQGAINGNEEVFFDWQKAKIIEWGGTQYTRQKGNYRAVRSGIGDGPVVPKQRPRQMVIFSECTNVLVRDIQLLKSPFWTLHFADCDGATASGLKIWASLYTPNSDGLDITSCRNVVVSDCDIRTGDDAIAITGYARHFELPGFHNLLHPSENITITNCNLQSRSSGIRIGFLDQNSLRNIHISNINITDSNRGIGIFVRDEGSVENITIAQVTIQTRMHTGDWWGNGEPIHISAVRGRPDVKLGRIKNISFRDVICKGENGILIYGSEESKIEDIRFENMRFQFVDSRINDIAGGNIDLRGAMGDRQLFSSEISAFYAQHVIGLSLNNMNVEWGYMTEDYFRYGVHINHFMQLILTNINTASSPSNKNLPAVFIENGSGVTTDLSPDFYRIKNVN